MGLINYIRRCVYARIETKKVASLRAASRLPVVPTKFGLAFFAMMLVLFIWTINHQINLGYALIFLLIFLSMFSAAITVGTLAKLELRCIEAEAVFAGDVAYFPIVLQDLSGRERGAVSISNEFYRADCDGIDAGGSTQVLLQQPTWQRGWLELLPFEVYTTMPLDLFVAWTWLRLEGYVLVYPAPVGELPLPLLISEVEGEEQYESAGDDELVGLKSYQLGDPLSRVAWKQFGRGGDMLVKQFAGIGGERVILDFNRLGGDRERRISQLARWVVDAEKAGLYYALHLPMEKIEYARGCKHYHRCLTALAVL